MSDMPMTPQKIKSFLANYFEFEPDYFTVGGWRKNLSYFLNMGHAPAHIVDRIKFRIFPKLMIVPDFPSHLDVELASACQMRCPMCYTTHLPDRLKGIMTWDLYVKIVDEAVQRKVYSIKLSWRGEPMLNKHLVDMVRYAKEKGIKEVAFLTNAERLSPEIAEALVDAKLDWMSVSADGIGKIYDEIRFPAKFKETIERVRYMKAYRDKKGLKRPLIRVQSIMSAVEADPDAYFKVWEGVVDRINILTDHIRDFETRDDLEFDHYFVCPKPWHRLNIAHDGRVHQCGSDYSAELNFGDCNTQSMHEIWHGEGNTKLRASFKRHTYLDDFPVCHHCSYGLAKVPDTISADSEIKVNRYKSVPDIVKDGVVVLKTPEDRMTSQQKKAKKEQIMR